MNLLAHLCFKDPVQKLQIQQVQGLSIVISLKTNVSQNCWNTYFWINKNKLQSFNLQTGTLQKLADFLYRNKAKSFDGHSNIIIGQRETPKIVMLKKGVRWSRQTRVWWRCTWRRAPGWSSTAPSRGPPTSPGPAHRDPSRETLRGKGWVVFLLYWANFTPP